MASIGGSVWGRTSGCLLDCAITLSLCRGFGNSTARDGAAGLSGILGGRRFDCGVDGAA
jgi:hypothetical protein